MQVCLIASSLGMSAILKQMQMPAIQAVKKQSLVSNTKLTKNKIKFLGLCTVTEIKLAPASTKQPSHTAIAVFLMKKIGDAKH